MLQLHLSIGVTVAVVVLLRVLWIFYDRHPDPEPGAPIEHLAAKGGHYAPYAIMIIAPITGYIGTGVNTEYFFQFETPPGIFGAGRSTILILNLGELGYDRSAL